MMPGWIRAVLPQLATTTTTVRGMPGTVINTRAEIDTADVLRRLGDALGLIERHTPHYFRHLRRDFARLEVRRYACRGAFFPATRTCLVELTFTVNPAFSLAQVAATILHEAMHARLHALGFPLEMADRARQERFCRRGEIEFGQLVPGGEPVVARAMQTLQYTDAEVAPVIDEAVAARRIAEADLRAWKGPAWLKEALARQHGVHLE